MVGDYISTSWIGGKAIGAFAVAKTPRGSAFDQAIYVPATGFTAAAGSFVATSSGDHALPNAVSDHASPKAPIRNSYPGSTDERSPVSSLTGGRPSDQHLVLGLVLDLDRRRGILTVGVGILGVRHVQHHQVVEVEMGQLHLGAEGPEAVLDRGHQLLLGERAAEDVGAVHQHR